VTSRLGTGISKIFFYGVGGQQRELRSTGNRKGRPKISNDEKDNELGMSEINIKRNQNPRRGQKTEDGVRKQGTGNRK
jgi:hypothetical protein